MAKEVDAHCDHAFVYLRQEQRENGYDDYTVYDVYFCQKCLEYRRVAVKRVIHGRTYPA